MSQFFVTRIETKQPHVPGDCSKKVNMTEWIMWEKEKEKMVKAYSSGHYEEADPVCLLRSGSSHVTSTNVNTLNSTNLIYVTNSLCFTSLAYAFTPHHP